MSARTAARIMDSLAVVAGGLAGLGAADRLGHPPHVSVILLVTVVALWWIGRIWERP